MDEVDGMAGNEDRGGIQVGWATPDPPSIIQIMFTYTHSEHFFTLKNKQTGMLY